MMKYYTFNNGIQMPAFGTGTNTFGKENKDFHGTINFDTEELRSAIALGYRLIDTAVMYRNEAVIGKAVKESGIDRKEFFVVSKIPADAAYSGTNDLVKATVEQSLGALDIDYIDLYLIHFPLETNEDNLRVWKVLETYVDSGKIKSIGVSNFNEEQLGYLLDHARIKPVVNQFQSYPGRHQQAIIDFCKANDVIPEAYHSIAKITEEAKKMLTDMAKKYQKTWSQIILNYQLSEGLIVIPKSHNPSHQQANMDVFDFELTSEDKAIIKNM